jgi:hypothetical protein
MLAETLAHLKEHDFARGEEQADRDKIADACLELLLRQPVERQDQIQERALIVSEIRYRVLGQAENEEVEHELDGIVAPLTGPTGLVQDKLDSGLVLCSATVTRRLSNNGEGDITLKRPGRFVTGVDDLVEEYYILPAQDRMLASARRFKGRFELSITRRPALASHYQGQIAKAYEQLAIELPRERS